MFEALLDGERPQTTIYWLRRPPGHGPHLLGQMARGEVEISHDTFRALPSDKAHNYLRDLLTAVGVLPPYDAQLERITPWLDQHLARLPKDHADLISRYARWHVLRRLRQDTTKGPISRARVLGWRARINAAIRFLTWAASHDTTITGLTQGELEHYLATRRGAAGAVHSFVAWARETGLNPDLRVTIAESATPTVAMSDDDRWRHVHLLLHDESIRLYARIGGLFMLLFARPLAAICLMRTDQIASANDGHVFVTFDSVPVQMPEPLDQLILNHVNRRGQASYAARDNGWLFPGGIPGNALATENIRAELVNHGIHPAQARKAALFALAADVPAPVLADLIGIAPTTAVKWATLAARDWSQYAADRVR